jgi:hypothetical protein
VVTIVATFHSFETTPMNLQPQYVVGHCYTRDDIFDMLGITPRPTGGNWFTGYNRHGDDWYIFCGVGVLSPAAPGTTTRTAGKATSCGGGARPTLTRAKSPSGPCSTLPAAFWFSRGRTTATLSPMRGRREQNGTNRP